MGVSCSDFTDGVLDLLAEHGFIHGDDVAEDSPERQFQVASVAIHRLGAFKTMAVALAAKVKEGGASEDLLKAADDLARAADRIAPKYLVCDGWDHIFSGTKPTTTRWVMDLGTGKMVVAQKFGSTWYDMRSDDVDDLMESVRDANNVRANPQDFGATTVDELPAW